MTVSKVFEICNAYETGVGHGQKKDGFSAGPYSDPELNEAYIEGYRHGCVLAKDKTCLNCKFEPEWTPKTSAFSEYKGTCRWFEFIGTVPPPNAIDFDGIVHNEISKTYPIECCPTWEQKV